MSEPLSETGTAAALGGATAFGLFANTDFGIVFGVFAGCCLWPRCHRRCLPGGGGSFSGGIHHWCAGGKGAGVISCNENRLWWRLC